MLGRWNGKRWVGHLVQTGVALLVPRSDEWVLRPFSRMNLALRPFPENDLLIVHATGRVFKLVVSNGKKETLIPYSVEDIVHFVRALQDKRLFDPSKGLTLMACRAGAQGEPVLLKRGATYDPSAQKGTRSSGDASLAQLVADELGRVVMATRNKFGRDGRGSGFFYIENDGDWMQFTPRRAA